MAGIRSNADIIKGSKLMLFIGDNPVGFATSHSLNLTRNTTEVSTKDHGDYPAVIPQSISWEVTAENLYSVDGKNAYLQALLEGDGGEAPFVHIQFVDSDYSNGGDEKGVIEPNAEDNNDWQVSSVIAEGDALVTSFSINAPSGDNATMSVTFTGSGALTYGD